MASHVVTLKDVASHLVTLKDVVASHLVTLKDVVVFHVVTLKDVVASHLVTLKDVVASHVVTLKDVVASHLGMNNFQKKLFKQSGYCLAGGDVTQTKRVVAGGGCDAKLEGKLVIIQKAIED